MSAPADNFEPCEQLPDPHAPGLTTDTCGVRSLCMDVDPDTGVGACVELCSGPELAPTCVNPGLCVYLADRVLNLCVPACDPLSAGTCPDRASCVGPFPVDAPQAEQEFICEGSRGSALGGDPCECASCCADGHACVPSEDYGSGCAFDHCCAPYCEVGGDGSECLGDGQTCVPVFDPGRPRYPSLGLCQVRP